MYRLIMNDLMEWYERGQDKVLLLKGAQGVGKTWVVTDFAQGFFKHMLYVNLEQNPEIESLFKRRTADNWLAALEQYCGQSYVEGETLLVLDEVQHSEQAVEAVRSLRQQTKIPVCMIASTMGQIPHEMESLFQVLRLYPMTFEEFLIANREQELCRQIGQQKLEPVETETEKQVTLYLKIFYLTGGMPIVVQDYIRNRDLARVDAILRAMLERCLEHIRQQAPANCALKAERIWNSLPRQMEKDNHKFMYQYVDEKARAREYERAVTWLVDTGLVRKVNRIRDGIAPVSEQIDTKSFELYHLDHGLLRVMCGIPYHQIQTGANQYGDVNGALIEQYVLSELTMNPTVDRLYFWISSATAKVDFVFEYNGEIVPVAIQPQIRRKAQSVKVFRKKYGGRMTIRISLEGLGFAKSVLNLPLYGLWEF